jgi:hypothetical protein
MVLLQLIFMDQDLAFVLQIDSIKISIVLLKDSKIKVHLLLDSKVNLLLDSKIKVHLLKDFKTNALLLNLLALLHLEILSHLNFKGLHHHSKFSLANSPFHLGSKTKALHNLDFKIRVHKVDNNFHNLKTGDVLQTNNSLFHLGVQTPIISASLLLLLNRKILAISANLEDKVIMEVLKIRTKTLDNNHLLDNKDNEIELLAISWKVIPYGLLLLEAFT